MNAERENNPYASPTVDVSVTRSGHSRLRDAWFIVFPLLHLAFCVQWSVLFSPSLPEGNPRQESWATGLFAAEWGIIMISWCSTGIWTCLKLKKVQSIRHKRDLCLAAIGLAPVVCPLVYFCMLRPKIISSTEEPPPPASQDRAPYY